MLGDSEVVRESGLREVQDEGIRYSRSRPAVFSTPNVKRVVLIRRI